MVCHTLELATLPVIIKGVTVKKPIREAFYYRDEEKYFERRTIRTPRHAGMLRHYLGENVDIRNDVDDCCVRIPPVRPVSEATKFGAFDDRAVVSDFDTLATVRSQVKNRYTTVVRLLRRRRCQGARSRFNEELRTSFLDSLDDNT